MSSEPRAERRRKRGAYKKSDESRRQVVDAAITALSERGYANTSIQDIARVAGMSKGAVHYHFESKQALIEEVLRHCADTMRARVQAVWEAGATREQRVTNTLRVMREMRRPGGRELRVVTDLTAQGLHDPALFPLVAQMLEQNRREILEQLTLAVGELGLSPQLPLDLIPHLLLGLLDGLALHDTFEPPDDTGHAAVTAVLEQIALALVGLGSRGP